MGTFVIDESLNKNFIMIIIKKLKRFIFTFSLFFSATLLTILTFLVNRIFQSSLHLSRFIPGGLSTAGRSVVQRSL